MIGAGANRKLCSKMLRQFVDSTGIPFFTTQMGKGVIDETHPLWLGNASLSDGDFVHRAIDHADCIINVGHDVIEKPPFFMREGRRTVIHVNFASAEVDPVYFPQIEVVGDIANSVWRMKQRISPCPHWDFCVLLPMCASISTPTWPKARTMGASRSTRSAWWPMFAR